MTWDWGLVFSSLPLLWSGLLVTVLATFLGTILAMVLGLVLALLTRVRFRAARLPIETAREFIQDTPILVQLFFVYFVVPQYIGIRMSALVTGIVVLGIHFATYISEVYRAGIDAVPIGQWEAARALSLPRARTWQAVILPQAIPPVLPALGNYVISMLKSSPQLLAIGVLEVVGAAQRIGTEQFRYFELYTVVAVLFLLLSYPSSLLVRRLEKRFGELT